MAHANHSSKTQGTDANMVAFILILCFFIVGGLMLSKATLPTSSANANPPVIALEATATPLPPTLPPPTATLLPTLEPTALPVATEGSATTITASYDPALVEQGKTLFLLCSACHGADARGLPKLGKDLVTSEFAKGLTDDELMTFIKTGRPIWDALNTTGVDMPAKGGNPAMKDEEILAVIAYIRTLEAAG